MVFIAKGNHDAESQITRQLPLVDGVHVFNARRCETVEIAALGVALHARSFPERAVTEDLVPQYPDAIPGKFNIGILHTSLTGNPNHDSYAPTSVSALCFSDDTGATFCWRSEPMNRASASRR